MIEVRFRPFTTWPQAETDPRTGAQFSASWSSTLALLDLELRALKAEDVVIETGHRKTDIRLDGWPKADARVPPMPGVILSFASKHGPLRYLTDQFDRGGYQRGSGGMGGSWMPGWQANLRAIALGLEALRAVDRYGVSRRGEQYRGWNELPSGIPMEEAMSERDAAALLFPDDPDWMLDIGDRELVGSQFRHLSKGVHPDAPGGGDVEAFRRLARARDLLLGRLS
jgi:hypothetical protein